jgi:serine/threonine protein kinase
VLDLYKFGVFHGDLSPHNIMIDREGHLRLLDFGLANCKAGMARATPAFAAPERLCGEPASLAADIFSLGRIEQFLRGKEPSPDPSSPYLEALPGRRALRGWFSKDERRAALGAKILAFRRRQELSRFAKTRTHILRKTLRPASVFLAAITGCLLLALSGGEKSSAQAEAAVLRIRTQRWHYFRLNGRPLGYSPVDVPLEPGKSYTLEWTAQNGGGTRELRVPGGRIFRYTDRDFSH